MKFEWDHHKADENFRKHGVDFADAVFVLEDPHALSFEDNDHHEERFITIGADPGGVITVVVYTYRDDSIRVISARRATSKERKQYEG